MVATGRLTVTFLGRVNGTVVTFLGFRDRGVCKKFSKLLLICFLKHVKASVVAVFTGTKDWYVVIARAVVDGEFI